MFCLVHLFRPKSLTSHAANVFSDLKFQWNPSEFLLPGTHDDCWDEAAVSISLSSFLPRPSCESEMKSLAFPVSPSAEVPARKICGYSIVIIYSLSFSGLLSCLKTGAFGLKTYISSSKTELDSDEGVNTPCFGQGLLWVRKGHKSNVQFSKTGWRWRSDPCGGPIKLDSKYNKANVCF